jgi:hypothetical protein
MHRLRFVVPKLLWASSSEAMIFSLDRPRPHFVGAKGSAGIAHRRRDQVPRHFLLWTLRSRLWRGSSCTLTGPCCGLRGQVGAKA